MADKEENIIFLGRLATYKYLDMWMAIRHVMNKINKFINHSDNKSKLYDFNFGNKEQWYIDMTFNEFDNENYLQFFNKAKDQIVNLNPTNQDDSRNVKYEVSKGLAYPCDTLLVPKNNNQINLLESEVYKSPEVMDFDELTISGNFLIDNTEESQVFKEEENKPSEALSEFIFKLKF